MNNNDFGIDLGTSNIRINTKTKGLLINEPSIIALDKDTNKVIAIGKEAYKILGKNPKNITIIKPIKNGVISDMNAAEILLEELIKRLKINNLFIKPQVLICYPSSSTELEKNIIKELVERTGARKVYISEKTKIAALGIGLDINKPTANMIVDIGGGTTDISIISMNEIVVSKTINIAGNKFNEDIINFIKKKYKLLIGEKTTEEIKKKYLNIYNSDNNVKFKITGKDLITGLPSTIEISQTEIKESIYKSINEIIISIISVLEESPPEISADIVEKGIVLTGGSSQICGLIELLKERLKIPVFIAESPLTSVAEGSKIMLEELKKYQEDH